METTQKTANKTFGTFQGVFIPTVLTILGIILFLRLPWVVGNAGVLGAVIIILISVAITFITTLSLSSIVTNMRIGAGGAFSIISKSLGLEIGGSIGIPLYLSQAIAVTMYIFGFREGWLWIFPSHPAIIIDLLAFALIFTIAITSTDFAFKMQYFIMAIVVVALGSIIAGFLTMETLQEPKWIGSFMEAEGGQIIGAEFWVLFAIFFPAVTGIMAGLNMSGELENPRESIPKGTIMAVVITSLIYLGLALITGYMGSELDLRNNYTFYVDSSFMPILVLIGLLGATFSSALTSFVGAPRVLKAIANESIVPFSDKLRYTNKNGEPLGSLIVTGVIVFSGILLRELNLIAPLITMFFLITYAVINLVVLIEQSLALPSFRPTFSVPIYVPLIGTLGCFAVMLIINPAFTLLAIFAVVAFYIFLSQKELDYDGGFARSGLFTAMAQWASKKANSLSSGDEPKAWQPDLLFPLRDTKELKACYRLIHSIIHPKGSLRILGIGQGLHLINLRSGLQNLVEVFKTTGFSVSFSTLESGEFAKSVEIGTEALGAAIFKSNTLFLKIDQQTENVEEYAHIIKAASKNRWAVLIYASYAKVGLGIERTINVWLEDIPDNWVTNMDLGNNDLSIISSLVIHKNWKGQLNVILLATDDLIEQNSKKLNKIKTYTRLPKAVKLYTLNKNKERFWEEIPQADLNISSIPELEELETMMKRVNKFRSSFIFTMDSGKENAQL